jgi:hypothetical protein
MGRACGTNRSSHSNTGVRWAIDKQRNTASKEHIQAQSAGCGKPERSNMTSSSLAAKIEASGSPLGPCSERDLATDLRSDSTPIAIKAGSSEPRKTISVSANHDDLRSFAQLAISVPNWYKGLNSDNMHGQRSNEYKSSRGFRWTSLTISYTRSATYKLASGSRLTSLTISYTCSAVYKSVRDSWLTFLIIYYTFYTCITAYKK